MEWRHTIYHEQELIFSSVPKVANTSIKTALQKAIIPPDQRAWVHSAEAGFKTVKVGEIFGKYAHYFRFAFVRNPFDRVVSFYFSKIDKPDEVIPPLRAMGFSKAMTFSEAARLVCQIPDGQADVHFRSQHKHLTYQRSLIPNFVGRFENLERDWQVVRAAVRARGDVRLPVLPHKVATDHHHFSEYYTPDVASHVARRYRVDLELFGYQFPALREIDLPDEDATDEQGVAAGT